MRYRTNDYSVPVAHGHQEVWVRGYVHEVVIGCGAEIIARHPRSYDQEDMVFDPIHYLPLLEQKTGALDQAAPLVGWNLPDAFPTLRRLLEARLGKAGKREYVQVLRLWRPSISGRSMAPSRTPCAWARSATMPSSSWCCAGLSTARPGSTWMSIPIYPGLGWRPRPPPAT